MYDLEAKSQRRTGLGFRNGPPEPLLSTFRKPSVDSEPHIAKSAKGDSAGNGWLPSEEDEISGSKALSISTSPRGTHIRRTPVPETSHDSGMDDRDDFVDIDSFATPVQTKTRSKTLAGMREDGDITPTTWKLTAERNKETQRLLREKNLVRVNPQYGRAVGFDFDSVRKAPVAAPGASWDKGPGVKKKSATYGRRPVARSRKYCPCHALRAYC